jgi:antitoxin (DNA-binding transcriptional repressor) of toxin-antitoxin stability system
MTQIINIENSKLQLSDLLALVRGGDEVIVQEANMPIARISSLVKSVAPKERKPFIFGLSAGMGTVPDDFNDELPMEFWLGDDA